MVKKIGKYQILKSIAKGGMGEVFLAHDPHLGRSLALKQIREDLLEKPMIRKRFLREAVLASRLSHPSIIPIYEIHQEEKKIFYTMPYIEGQTLKEILYEAKKNSPSDETSQIGHSIPTLCRIFLHVCEAVAYTHAQNILHRDLKPENIIYGKYGETLILDWGIADFADEEIDNEDIQLKRFDITLPGKIAGTLAFLAPERAKGAKASFQTDIYALGVMLYQILTLEVPFRRVSLKMFKKMVDHEIFTDPIEKAPYRDIPEQLSQITKKCLAPQKERYPSVQDLINDLKKYIEGTPDWILAKTLDLQEKKDWQFHENILLAKHIAISQQVESMEWVSLMISKKFLHKDLKIEAKMKLNSASEGVGFLLCIPETKNRRNLEEGYLIWIGKNCQLFRSNVFIAGAPSLKIEKNQWHHIRIEKLQQRLSVYLNDELIFSYTSHLPLQGEHVGLLYRDPKFQIQDFSLYHGTHEIEINCLEVPDAFFIQKNFEVALQEYRRVGLSFPGREEGREALFRAGLTLLEQAKLNIKDRSKLLQQALNEFEKLHKTAGAPLEYLGKSFVYAYEKDYEEEAKCLELAVRMYPNHPLLPILEEHIVYRMHESALEHREAAFRLVLLVLRHLSHLLENQDTKLLVENLDKNIVSPYFFQNTTTQNVHENLAIKLAFLLHKKTIIIEILEEVLEKNHVDPSCMVNGIFSLLELGEKTSAKKFYQAWNRSSPYFEALFSDTKKMPTDPKSWIYWVYLYLQSHLSINLPPLKLSEKEESTYDTIRASSLLYHGDLSSAKALFQKYPQSQLKNENDSLFWVYGCYLSAVKGVQMGKQHLRTFSEIPFPSSPLLLSFYLMKKIDFQSKWAKHCFWWEKKDLLYQLVIYNGCIQEKVKQKSSLAKFRKCI